MITEKRLQTDNLFKYKHIQTYVIKKDEADKVLAFAAIFVDAKLPGESLSAGMKEMNQTLWDQLSPKRPTGYWMIGSWKITDEKFDFSDRQGLSPSLSLSFFVASEWNDMPKERREADEKVWTQLGWLPR